MLFVIEGRDGANMLETRLSTRPAHLDYIKSLGDKVIFGGPFLDQNEKPNGSLIVIKAQDLAEAKLIANNDPYVSAGVFETSEVRQWNMVINNG